MITIEIDAPQDIKPTPLSPMSGFISFPYDPELVNFIKGLGNRVYDPDTHEWEVPVSAVAKICNSLPEYDIEITGVYCSAEQKTLPDGFTFKTQPYSHQLDGVLFGLEAGTFLLGDGQGLGKTKQVIDLALARKAQEGMKHCLIICGVNGTKYNWLDEIHTHSDEDGWVLGTRFTKKRPIRMKSGTGQDKLNDLKNLPDKFFLITNIETLRALPQKVKYGKKGRHKVTYPIAEQIQKLCDSGEIGMIAFDEAHKAKNPSSQLGTALLSIKPKYAIPMSGTFLLNSPLDLYVPLKWAGFEEHDFYHYKMHYCKMGGFQGSEIVGYKNLKELRDTMESVMLRRTKAEVLDLPPKVHTTEYIEMGTKQQKIYDNILSDTRELIDKIKMYGDPLSEMIRLRQATGYPAILSTSADTSAKMERAVELAQEVASVGQKSIVFSQWEQMTLAAQKELSELNPAYISGAVNAEQRMREIERFQHDPECKVIIGTIGAMGTGLTLTAASTVIFLDEPWNRAIKDQAEDRAHRIGTTGTVNIITLVCKNTIDEKILDLVASKGAMGDMLIDGKFTVSDKSSIVDYLLS